MTPDSNVSVVEPPSEGMNTVRPACECPNTFSGAQGEVLELNQLCNCNFVSLACHKHYPASTGSISHQPLPLCGSKPSL